MRPRNGRDTCGEACNVVLSGQMVTVSLAEFMARTRLGGGPEAMEMSARLQREGNQALGCGEQGVQIWSHDTWAIERETFCPEV